MDLTLVSHALCPYVQRAAIALAEKGTPFTRRDVDLARKPDWFLAISPLGKTPVLLAGETPIFESAAIIEYLDDAIAPRLHPDNALTRARHRAWIEFGSTILNDIAGLYAAPDAAAFRAKADLLATRFARIEDELGQGPWVGGKDFSLVDAVFGPVFRYFDTFDTIGDFGILAGKPKVAAWRRRLAARPSVAGAVAPDYPVRLAAFLRARGSHISTLMTEPAFS